MTEPKASETITRGHPAFKFKLHRKSDGLWLQWLNPREGKLQMLNLGHEDDAFEEFARVMEEADYGER